MTWGKMNETDAQEYTESLAQIFAGSWRQIVWAKQQGIPKALGLTTEEWVRKHLGGYVRLSIEERRGAVEELVADGMSNVAISDALGVDEKTIRRDNAAANAEVSDPESSNGKGADKGMSANAEPSTDVETPEQKAARLAPLQRASHIELLYQFNNVASLVCSDEKTEETAELILKYSDEYEKYARHSIDELRASLSIVAERTATLIEALKEDSHATEPARCPRCDGEGCRWCNRD